MATESSVKTVVFGEDDCHLMIRALQDAVVSAAQMADSGHVREYKRLKEEIKARLKAPLVFQNENR